MTNVYLEVESQKKEIEKLNKDIAGLENDVEELTNKNELLINQMSGIETGLENDAINIKVLSIKIQNIRHHKANKPVAPSGLKSGMANRLVDNYITKTIKWFDELNSIVG